MILCHSKKNVSCGRLFFFLALFMLANCFFSSIAKAGIVIHGTRIIYPADKKSVMVRVENLSDSPALAQVWIDGGDPGENAKNSDVPFFITPAISRVEPQAGQAFRIIKTSNDGELITGGVEKLFYFNLLEIPPVPKAKDGENTPYVQINIRNRLKIFFRPSGLDGKPIEAVGKLQWQWKSENELKISNPSAYHINFADSIYVKNNNGVIYKVNHNMIEPKSETVLDVNAVGEIVAEIAEADLFAEDSTVSFKYINDFGTGVKSAGKIVFNR